MKKQIRYILALIVVAAALLLGYTGDTDNGDFAGGGSSASNMSMEAGAADEAAAYDEDSNKNSYEYAGENSYGDTKELSESSASSEIEEDGVYTSKDEVAEYIHLYGHLPDNFITKSEAKKLGWVSSEGNLGEAAPGKSIGGDHFGNYEGTLPEKKGRSYTECDIDSDGGYRGAKRIIFSNDGLIYYTGDHYETFELLYGEES